MRLTRSRARHGFDQVSAVETGAARAWGWIILAAPLGPTGHRRRGHADGDVSIIPMPLGKGRSLHAKKIHYRLADPSSPHDFRLHPAGRPVRDRRADFNRYRRHCLVSPPVSWRAVAGAADEFGGVLGRRRHVRAGRRQPVRQNRLVQTGIPRHAEHAGAVPAAGAGLQPHSAEPALVGGAVRPALALLRPGAQQRKPPSGVDQLPAQPLRLQPPGLWARPRILGRRRRLLLPDDADRLADADPRAALLSGPFSRSVHRADDQRLRALAGQYSLPERRDAAARAGPDAPLLHRDRPGVRAGSALPASALSGAGGARALSKPWETECW